jgi:gamma-glutamyltranspeptidase/glutathione hydrolase/leukotriene-C4 hydrolase
MFGSVPWRRLFEPSIKLAREGFTVSALLEDRITEDLEHILKSQAFAEVFAPGGVPLKQGETIYRRDFADTLALIAEQGPDAFYSGRIADSLVRQIQSTGGVITKEDLAGYKPRVEDALVGYYHGRKVMTTGAPSR